MRAGRLALDARLDEIAASRRLLVTLDRPPREAEPLLSGLPAVQGLTHLDAGGAHYRYALDTADPQAAAPAVARSVGEAGWDLYGLAPEVRDLETLFGEVNEQHEEAVHA
jgi:ABC-2 type transport system ATP-binding protein